MLKNNWFEWTYVVLMVILLTIFVIDWRVGATLLFAMVVAVFLVAWKEGIFK